MYYVVWYFNLFFSLIIYEYVYSFFLCFPFFNTRSPSHHISVSISYHSTISLKHTVSATLSWLFYLDTVSFSILTFPGRYFTSLCSILKFLTSLPRFSITIFYHRVPFSVSFISIAFRTHTPYVNPISHIPRS